MTIMKVMIMIILVMMVIVIITTMIIMIEIILIIAVVIINSPFQSGDFSPGSTADYIYVTSLSAYCRE